MAGMNVLNTTDLLVEVDFAIIRDSTACRLNRPDGDRNLCG
ncbi:MAG: hypothetical protein ACLTZT_10235 [Butyricimonas faecalis]